MPVDEDKEKKKMYGVAAGWSQSDWMNIHSQQATPKDSKTTTRSVLLLFFPYSRTQRSRHSENGEKGRREVVFVIVWQLMIGA